MTDDAPRTVADLATAQPTPTRREQAPSLHTVAAALHAHRREVGISTYGMALTTHNGRSAGIDQIQEAADGLVYTIQRTLEHAALCGAIRLFRERLAMDHVRRGTDAASILAEFDALFAPGALMERTDEMGRALIADAGGTVTAAEQFQGDLGEEAYRVAKTSVERHRQALAIPPDSVLETWTLGRLDALWTLHISYCDACNYDREDCACKFIDEETTEHVCSCPDEPGKGRRLARILTRKRAEQQAGTS